jgi:hypothetical protein
MSRQVLEPDTATADRRTTWLGTVVLLTVLALATATALFLGPDRPQWAAAVGFAAIVTGAANLGGWLVGRRQSASPGGGVAAALGGTTLRLLLPLAALGWLTSGAPLLKQAGGRGLLVGFYLLLLATTIILTIMNRGRGSGNPAPD